MFLSRVELAPPQLRYDELKKKNVTTVWTAAGRHVRIARSVIVTGMTRVKGENKEKTMNILLWVVQSVLALLCVSGGAYKVFKFDELTKQTRALSHGGWRALGVIEVVCGVLLIVPAAANWMPFLTPFAAGVLAVEALGLSALYARRSLKLTAANPLVWSFALTLMAGFVAYAR